MTETEKSADQAEQGGAQHEATNRGTVIVSSTASDSHTWNLVFLQFLIEELGYVVVNLGPCVPDELLVEECRDHNPVVVVLSSVNGHGYQDGLRVIERLRGSAELAAIPMVIGGKLGVCDPTDDGHVLELMVAGFDDVFEDGVSAVADFRTFMNALPAGAPALPGNTRVGV